MFFSSFHTTLRRYVKNSDGDECDDEYSISANECCQYATNSTSCSLSRVSLHSLFFFCIISIGFFYSVEVFQHRCLQQTAMLSLFHRLAQLHLCLRLLLLLRTLISYFVTCFIFLFANWIFLWIIQSTTIDALNELFVALQGIALMLLYREILF